jgi:nitronate monooxygenase
MVVDHGPDGLVISDRITGTPASWLRPSPIANGLDPDRLTKPAERGYDSTAGVAARRKDRRAAGPGLQAVRGVEPAAAVVAPAGAGVPRGGRAAVPPGEHVAAVAARRHQAT